MIQAQTSGPRAWFWRRYVAWALRRQFQSIEWNGPRPSGPVVLCANHSNYWDGFVLHALATHWGFDGYCMMDAAQLRTYPFLRHVGAFSVDKSAPARAVAAIRYARQLLTEPSAKPRAVAIFPEGELRALATPPLSYERGAIMVAALAGVPIVPVAIRYVFLAGEKPHVWLRSGEPIAVDAASSRHTAASVLLEPLCKLVGDLQQAKEQSASVTIAGSLRPRPTTFLPARGASTAHEAT